MAILRFTFSGIRRIPDVSRKLRMQHGATEPALGRFLGPGRRKTEMATTVKNKVKRLALVGLAALLLGGGGFAAIGSNEAGAFRCPPQICHYPLEDD